MGGHSYVEKLDLIMTAVLYGERYLALSSRH